MSLKSLNIGGWETLVNADYGYAPYFTNELKYRMNRKRANNIVVTAEAGIGKTYQADSMCRVLNKRYDDTDIVFTYKEYMINLLRKRRQHVPILFDEPQYSLDKREWFKQVNQALIKTLTSQRFRLRPLFIPIINMDLLDKSLRSYLIQYHVIMTDRGRAVVYRLTPSQTDNKLYRSRVCRLEYGLFDQELCDKESCLSCSDLKKGCDIHRAKYERRKLEQMTDQDELSLAKVEQDELKKQTDDDITASLYADYADKIVNESGKLDINLIAVVLRRKLGINVGRNRLYRLRGTLLADYPEFRPRIVDVDV